MDNATLYEIADSLCPYPSGAPGRTAWLRGFHTYHKYKFERKERWKKVNVYLKGLLVYKAECLKDASEYTGLSRSSICTFVKNKKTSKGGYSFKAG
jgi:hypothetical protein